MTFYIISFLFILLIAAIAYKAYYQYKAGKHDAWLGAKDASSFYNLQAESTTAQYLGRRPYWYWKGVRKQLESPAYNIWKNHV